jgi:hypothetical protein
MKNLLTYNIAILVSFAILFLVRHLVVQYVDEEYIIISLTAFTTLGIFNVVILLLLKLERNFLWKFHTDRPNLEGMWKASYKHSNEDDKNCYSIVEITQDNEFITMNGRNFQNDSKNYHSIWVS